MIGTLLWIASLPFRTVDIHYGSASAKSVQFAGDLTGWDSPKPLNRSGDDWTIQFRVPVDARFEYKLIVDGTWILDPNDPLKCDNGVGGENSVWQGPAYRFNPDDQAPKHALNRRVITVGGRQITVFSPENPKGMPILVYGDGPNYESYGHIQNVIENLVEEGRIRPVVVVLVPPIDRMKEYGTDWKRYGGYLLDQVLPEVRRQTEASDSPADLYLGGSSMGGVIALRLAEEFPDKVEGGVHSQSGAFQWSPLNLNYTSLVAPQSLKRLAPTTRIWIDWGRFEDGLTAANEKAAGALREIGKPFGYAITDEGHNWTAWRHRMVKGLTYLLGPPG